MKESPLPYVQHHEVQGIVIRDESNPRSVINLLPPKFAERVREVMLSHPDHFNLEEGELYRHLKSLETKPNGTDDILRLKFWLEFERVQNFNLPQMNMTYICAGVCDLSYFTQFYMRAPYRVAWLLCVPINYAARLDEMQNEGLRAMSEVMREPMRDPSSGKLNFKLVDMKLKIYNLVSARREAMNPSLQSSNQNIQVNVGVNLEKDAAKVTSAIEGNTVEAMQRRLHTLQLNEARLERQQSQPQQLVEVAYTPLQVTDAQIIKLDEPTIEVSNPPLVETGPERGTTGYDESGVGNYEDV